MSSTFGHCGPEAGAATQAEKGTKVADARTVAVRAVPGSNRVDLRWIAIAGAIAVALTGLARPSGGGTARWHAPAFSAAWNLKVGFGAEYEATCSYAAESVVDLAIIGEQGRGKRKMYWMEISSRYPGSLRPFVNKALFYRKRNDLVFVRGVTQLPGRPPMDVPDRWLAKWTRGELAAAVGFIEPYTRANFSPTPSAEGHAVGATYPPGFFGLEVGLSEIPEATPLGEKALIVPAGNFRTRLWHMNATSAPWLVDGGPVRVWVASGAGPFGIVKASMQVKGAFALSSAMVLTRVYTNAKDSIVGRPLPSQPDVLWHWIWEHWASGRPGLCLPQVGLPEPGAPG